MIHNRDLKIGKMVDPFDREIRKAFNLLPLPALIWKVIDKLDFQIRKMINALNLKIGEVLDDFKAPV